MNAQAQASQPGQAGTEFQQRVENQREFFRSKSTRPIEFRRKQLQKLLGLIERHEDDLHHAIYEDFGKSVYDSKVSEIYPVYGELKAAIKHIGKWAKPRKVSTNLLNQPGKSYIVPEPLGVSLVIGAWNFPYNLSLIPTIGSMVAGNVTILKPSELPANTSRAMARLINDNFDPNYLQVVEGGIPETTALLQQRFDKIFFTGSPAVGRIVNEAAAPYLTNVTLELGGKNPAIFATDASINVGVKRLVWAKFVNAGQICLAPDYVLVPRSLKQMILDRMVHEIQKHQYSIQNQNYVRIINERNFDRVASFINPDNVYFGGESNREERVIEPTILHNVSMNDAVMQEEIFGPVMAVIDYDDIDEAFEIVAQFEKPLAAYLFSNDKNLKRRFLDEVPFGGGCINDAVMHVSNNNLPFGGVGNSGMGSYHGRHSFDCFSHLKSVLEKATFFESNLKYYENSDSKLKWIKRLL